MSQKDVYIPLKSIVIEYYARVFEISLITLICKLFYLDLNSQLECSQI